MHFTQVSTILAILSLSPSTLCAPNPNPAQCKGPGGSSKLVTCLTANSQYCQGGWDTQRGGDDTQIQTWAWGANNVNEWDQHKFSQQLIKRACAPTGMQSKYNPSTLTAAATWTSSGTCTAGRVTAAIANSAGLRRVDCTKGDRPGNEAPEGMAAGVKGLLEGLKVFKIG